MNNVHRLHDLSFKFTISHMPFVFEERNFITYLFMGKEFYHVCDGNGMLKASLVSNYIIQHVLKNRMIETQV